MKFPTKDLTKILESHIGYMEYMERRENEYDEYDEKDYTEDESLRLYREKHIFEIERNIRQDHKYKEESDSIVKDIERIGEIIVV